MGRIQRVFNKWSKAKLVMKHGELNNYHPKTKYLSEGSLHQMLKDYNMVYIKPVYGMHGKGVMRLDRKNSGYRLRSGSSKRKFSSYSSLYQKVRNTIKKKPYMVQKGIRLMKYQNCSFDVRVMIQKNNQKHWEYSGMLCRVANPKGIVTNLVRGGRVMPVDRLLQLYLSTKKSDELKAKMKKIGLKTAYHFQKRYPGIKELGLDIAIDREGKPWILEVNTMPDLYLFSRLSDKKMFRRIIKNAKDYGRM
ncbi:YheC/YheD family protein [Brevibacillus sp. SYSU BS000544]|uniref:YheC/YheD family protein n=1 Tax=Brevibacillus sp. SYSU BS000544 TaxID=3416443 RepID=UPI003CE4E885